MEAKHTKKYR